VLLSLRVSLIWALKQCFPVVGTLGHEWVPERYGQFATSRLDTSRLTVVCKVSDVLRCPSSCWVFAFIGVENAFSPSVVESKHGWRTAMHLEGRNGVKNRNGACAMKVASLGSRAKMGTKEGGR